MKLPPAKPTTLQASHSFLMADMPGVGQLYTRVEFHLCCSIGRTFFSGVFSLAAMASQVRVPLSIIERVEIENQEYYKPWPLG